MNNLVSHPIFILGFAAIVIIMLIIDLGVFNKKSHAVSNKEALTWSIVWISLAMIFSWFIYNFIGFEKFTQFQSAYWIEKALSVDNLFVFILVFSFFNVPKEVHHKVLFWGILGALVFRAIFIFSGIGLINSTYLGPILQGTHSELSLIVYQVLAAISLLLMFLFLFKKNKLMTKITAASGVLFLLIVYTGSILKALGWQVSPTSIVNEFNIVLILFGCFLMYAGIKSWFVSEDDEEEKDFSNSPGAKAVYRMFKVSKEFKGDKFFTIENGVKVATPLLVVVGVIEFTDVLFAVDSIPAIFAIAPDDPFILYTSNIFAILGLRALYFLLANFIHMFRLLKYGLAIILSFIGFKMVVAPVFHISSPVSLLVVGSVLLLSVLCSVVIKPKVVE
jgi:tellurite resistance protein TerC